MKTKEEILDYSHEYARIIAKLELQRDTLLKACRVALAFCTDDVFDEPGSGTTADILISAIAKVEGHL